MSDHKLSRKDLLTLGGASLGAAALAGPSLAERLAGPKRPNILFITVDQLCTLAALPANLPLPNIRRLMGQGLSFSNYHVHQAPCGPSRSAIYTGQHVQKTGMYTNPPGEYAAIDPAGPPPLELSPSFITIGKMLREQGYYTAYKGKWHLSLIDQRVRASTPARAYPDASKALEPYGFSDYQFDGEVSGMMWAGFGHDGLLAADSIRQLRRFAKGSTKGKPWYLAVNFINPHDIMFYGDDDEVSPSAIGLLLPPPLLPPYDKPFDAPLPASLHKDDLSTKPPVQRARGPGGARRRDDAAWRVYRSYYFNCIRDVDNHIGQVLDALDRFGLASDTIVVLTADHGEQAGAHGLSGKGGTMYKETLNVPLIVRGPGVPRGKATAALAGGTDLSPSLLSLAGADLKAWPDLHGVDLSPVWLGRAARTERDERGVLLNFLSAPGPAGPTNPAPETRSQLRGVFDGRYKFARYFAIRQHHIPADWDTLVAHNDLELYDTHSDPDELTNLAARPQEHRELILSLNAKVNRLLATEVGADDGSIFPGGAARYQLKV